MAESNLNLLWSGDPDTMDYPASLLSSTTFHLKQVGRNLELLQSVTLLCNWLQHCWVVKWEFYILCVLLKYIMADSLKKYIYIYILLIFTTALAI